MGTRRRSTLGKLRSVAAPGAARAAALATAAVLDHVTLDAAQLAAVVSFNVRVAPGPSQAELAKIAKERQRALDGYVRDRDAAKLGEAMTTLDRDQAALQAPRPAEPVPADVAVRFLRELPRLGPRPRAARVGRCWPRRYSIVSTSWGCARLPCPSARTRFVMG